MEKETTVVKPKPKSKPKQFKAQKLTRTGIVYVGHIPHGFYEEQMEDYFKQFGNITRVRVARSKRVRIYLNRLIKTFSLHSIYKEPLKKHTYMYF